MRHLTLPAVLAAAVALGSATAALCCGGDRICLPTPVTTGIVRGEHFFGLTADGRVITADLRGHKVRELTELGFGLGTQFDAAPGRVAVRAGACIRIADAASGKVVADCPWDDDCRSFRFAGPQRLLVRRARGVDLVGIQDGKAAIVPLSGAARALLDTVDSRAGVDCDADGKRIYVLVGDSATVRGGLAVIDVDSGNVTNVAVPAPGGGPSRTQFRVIAGHAIILRQNRTFGYGYGAYGHGDGAIASSRLVSVNLTTGKHQSLTLAGVAVNEGSVFASDRDLLYLANGKDVVRYDVCAHAAARRRLTAGAFVGTWEGQAVALLNQRVVLVGAPLPAVQTP